MSYDIVYVLKNDIDDTELIYSVRSVCKNFEFNNIWFVGGTPRNIKPDHSIHIKQQGYNRWMKVTNTIKEICRNKDITDDFWLFNDDFFIMSKIDNLQPISDGTINRRIKELNKRNPGQSSLYAQQLYITEKMLKDKDCDTLNYALHIPMLINKEKALKTLYTFPKGHMFRSLYGNHHRIQGILGTDVKIFDPKQDPTGEEIMLSTSDLSFHTGRVGEYIRKAFPEKSKYET